MILVTNAVAIAVGMNQDAFGPKDVLASAVAVEGLIFVSFTLAFSLTQPKEGGRHPFFAQGWFGWVVVAAILGAASSAGAAWYEIYQPAWPGDLIGWLQAGGLALGIAVQPVFAGILNLQARP